MRYSRVPRALVASISLISASALANQDPPAPSLPEDAPAEEAEEDLSTQLEELREKIRRSEEERNRQINPLTINGYVDFGFFVPNGNGGVGWMRDPGNMSFPNLAQYSWVFVGDILGTPVNTRGEAADLGNEMAPGLRSPGVSTGLDERFDSIDSDGAPGFLVNEVNFRVGYQLAERVVLRTSLNFTPRSSAQNDFSLGDSFDVDIAEMEYLVTADGSTSVFVGKMLPVFGIEYKDRKSNQRFGITPSLVDRYTSGPQLGLKVRSRLLNEWLIVAASVTNNTSTTEQFHFYREIDSNASKVLNGRLAVSIPVWSGTRLELGGSGEFGTQDRGAGGSGNAWFAGGDLQLLGPNFAVKGLLMRGKVPGNPMGVTGLWSLDLKTSGYLEADWLFLPWLGVNLRGDLRDALVILDMTRAYMTKQWRFTGGLRVVFSPRIVLKAEYLHNTEFGGVQAFKNDIFTSSLVLMY